ncbi:MAG: rRNA maturation RNase YbeY [Flavobacteriales bacterium AspAUS03]
MIQYFYEIDFSIQDEASFTQWICTVIKDEGRSLSELNYIYSDDEYLFRLNQQYLGHYTYTDVIAFDNSIDEGIIGDVFISIERVADNARQLGESFQNELKRVMIHAVLHLLGYNDKVEDERQLMRKKEDFYLNLSL